MQVAKMAGLNSAKATHTFLIIAILGSVAIARAWNLPALIHFSCDHEAPAVKSCLRTLTVTP